MATRLCVWLLAILVASACASTVNQQDSSASSTASGANPIRRVVTLLQNMAKKIAAESVKEKELYDKYMCYCKNAGGTLQASIDAAGNKIPQVESALKEAEEQKAQLEQEVKDHQTSRADAKASMAKATALREKEASAFAKEKAEYDTNIGQLSGAITAIEKGMTGFLQTKAAEMVRRLALNSDLSDFDRKLVMSFLSGTQATNMGYVPKSGEITGILKEMKDTMAKDLADITSAEKTAIADYEELMESKTKEVHACTKAIETKSARVGELGVNIAEMKNDLDDTSAALLEDKKFLADMDKTCEAKKKEWDSITKARAEETVAIQETIKFLNDDDALELFKKTLPSPSFVQTVANFDHVKRKALALVQEVLERPIQQRAHLDMISLALSGRKVSFEKVTKMIDDMVRILGEEQVDDDNKKEYCEKQFDTSDDNKKGLQQDLKDLDTTIADSKETIATLSDEIKSLTEGIETLDKNVAESTETRKEEHAEYTELMSNDGAAKELLGVAKNRLNKYYNPKLYKPPPKRELSEEQRIYTNMGGELAPTAAPGGIAGSGVTAFEQIHEHRSISDVAPPPPPESFKAYAKKGEESTGVISMIDLLIADLDKEMTEAETAEKDAQKEYEAFMADAAEKRATDSKSITDKEGYKADAEATLEAAKEEQTSKVKELMATEKYIASLHAECDWLMSNFDIRKQARADEVEALKNAKAVLAGADFSFVQQQEVTRSLRGHH